MAKNRFFLAGILGIALVFSLAVMGCNDDSGGGGDNGDGNAWLVGVWKRGSGTASGTLLTLKEDGTWNIGGAAPGTTKWEVNNGVLDLKSESTILYSLTFEKADMSGSNYSYKLKITASPKNTAWEGDWYKQ